MANDSGSETEELGARIENLQTLLIVSSRCSQSTSGSHTYTFSTVYKYIN